MNQVSKKNALKCLNRALDQATEIRELGYKNPEFQKWKISTREDLKRIFRNQDDCHKDFDQCLIINRYEESGTNVERAIAFLKSKIELIEDDWTETEQDLDSHGVRPDMHRSSTSNKVFVVHGHDDAAREMMARFLEQKGLEAVILHEKSNKGHTIIEKFEDYANVGFAVVLLTPDDMGAPQNKHKHGLKPRARQNVIFELGYFIGKLGRKRVFPFVKDDVETPSDYDGVVYTPMDEAGGWKSKLIEELKSAGCKIDANL